MSSEAFSLILANEELIPAKVLLLWVVDDDKRMKSKTIVL